MRRPVKKIQDGFTLLELMIVVMIIGILASVALPAYQDYVTRAKISEGFDLAGPAQKAVSAHYDRWGKFPKDNAQAGLPDAKAFAGRYVSSVSIVSGSVVVDFGKLTDKIPAGSTLTLRPGINRSYQTGPLVWACGNQAPVSGFEFPSAVAPNPLADKLMSSGCRGLK